MVMVVRAFINIAFSLLLGLGTGGSAYSITEMLEKAIYEEETVGDLDAAIEIYHTIVDDAEADRPHVAQALYRLGQCQLKAGHGETAAGTFRKLVDQYPDQAEWVAKARTYLPDATAAGLEVVPAPWNDGELLRFVVRTKRGTPVGDLTYSAQSTTVEGRPAWRVETFMALPKPEVAKYAFIDTDRDSSVPLRHKLYHSQLGSLRAEYVGNERRITMNRPGEEPEPFTQKLSTVTFENEQVLYLGRRLPLAVGYETLLTITGRPGMTATASLKVQEIENVAVPAGVFECFRVEVGVPPFVETQWFTTDANRYPVKVANPEIDVELTEISSLPRGPLHFEDPVTGISLTAPSGWDIQKSSFRFAEHEFFLLIFPPGMEAKAAAVAQKLDERTSVREFAEADLGIYKSRRDSFQVHEDSWEELEISGAPAVGVMATLRAENQEVREYRVYVAGPSAYYWFIYRATPDRFDSLKSDFDAIVHSLTFG
jgi:hypothetical protein